MSENLKPYFVSGIVVAASVEDARDIAAAVMPAREGRVASGDELGEEPTLVSVMPFDDNADEEPIFFIEADDAGPNDFLALIHLKGTTEEEVEQELVGWLGNWNAYQKTLGLAEFDPDELEVDLDEALAEISDEAADSLGSRESIADV
jgi:hypothetical protein